MVCDLLESLYLVCSYTTTFIDFSYISSDSVMYNTYIYILINTRRKI